MSDPWEDYASKDGGPWSDYKSTTAVAEPPRTVTPDQFTTPMGGTPRPLLDSSPPPPDPQTETIESDIIQPVEKVIGGAVATVANIIPNTYNAAVRMTGKGHPAEMWMTPGKPLTSKAFGEALEGAVNDVFAPNHPEPAIEGLAKSARKAVEGFTTPESIAALPLFEFKAGRVALMALMAASTPAQIAETHKVLTDPKATTVQKWESLGDSGIQLAMTAGMALGLKPEEVKSTMTPDEAAQKAQSLTAFTDQALAATKEKLTQTVGKEDASEPEKPKEEPKTEAIVASEPVPTEPAPEPPKEQPKEIVDQPVNSESDTEEQLKFTGMGGAVPSEFERSPQTPTGIKNATVDKERAERGLPPAVEPLRKSFGEVWDKAMARIDREPEWIDNLTDELRDKPRALTDEEDAALLHRQVDLQNDYGKATRDLAQAHDDGNEALIQQAKIRTALLSDKLLDLYNIGKQAGTETGRGLNARKMMAYEDFSLAQMELSKRSANGGRPLTDAEHAENLELHKKIEATQKAIDDYRAATQERISKLESEATLNRIKAEESAKPQIHPAIIEQAKKIVSKIHDEAEKSRAILKERLGRASTGIDPTTLYHLSVVGADHLATAALDIAEWSVKMAQDLGEDWDKVKAHAQDIYDASEQRIRNATKDNLEAAREMRNKSPEEQIKANDAKIGEKIKAGKKNDISWHVQRIARLLVQSGVTDREALIGRVHEILKKHLPDITRRETMDAISGYGDFKQLSKDQISLQLRGMKGEMQQIAKLEDMQAGTPPLKSGVERRAPTDVERELLKKVNDAKNKFRVPMTDAATQLKSALDTVKTRLKNEITDLETQISRKQKTIKEKAPVPSDAASDALKQRRDELKAEYKALFDDPEAAYQKALQEYKNRTTKRTAELQDKIARGDFRMVPKRELKLDNEAMRLKAENERVKQKYLQGLNRDRLKQRTPWEKTMDAVVKWRRGFILSGPVTLAKLTSAALARAIITPIEEGVGAGIGKVFPRLSERAPREGGGLNLRAEVKSITEGITTGMRDAWETLRTGKSSLELNFGKDKGLPQSFIDIFGNVHGALKAPVKRAEFARSFEKRMTAYAKQGVDVTDEFVQARIGVEAFQDAQKAIFMQKNMVNDAYKRLLSRFDQADKKTGHPSMAGKVAGTTARTLMPIVKVPMNIVAETMQYAIGSITGSARLAKAYHDGIASLPPEEADLIMRHLKKGSLGAAVMLLGFLNPKVLGGFYQQGQKRDKKDIAPDAARVDGVNVPSYVIHNPWMSAAQIGATVRRVADSKLRKKDAETQGLSHGAMAGAFGLAEATPFVREMQETAKAFNAQERDKWLGELAKSLAVPQGLQSLAIWLDKNDKGEPVKRDPKTPIQAVETGIPGLRKNVPIKK